MTEEELREFIALSFANAGNRDWNGTLLYHITLSAIRVAKEKGILKEEKSERCEYVSDIDNSRCIGVKNHSSHHYFDSVIVTGYSD